MSHSVVITRTTTTSSGNAGFMVNSGYLKTFPGLLKLAQLILNAVCVGLVAYYFRRYHSVYSNGNPELFFLLMTTTFLIGTFCLLLSCLVSWSTGGIISKTIYELIYHTLAFLLLLIASIILLVEVTNNRFGGNVKEAYLAASIIGLINAGLYLISALLANRHYRGI
uniref:CSON011304 protein n=1 Tax=Culicoides sonorensis TaxID=179676 RepID=A0A336KC16_CULSO